MNFYSICIGNLYDCLNSVRTISEVGDSPITDKKVALKIYNQQKKDLSRGCYIFLYENGICIKENWF